MDNPTYEKYEPPAVEVLAVVVEYGYEGSNTDTTLPSWDKEDGYWQ